MKNNLVIYILALANAAVVVGMGLITPSIIIIKKHIHKDDSMMSYLGRGSNYSECGFLYFNMRHDQTRNYASYMKKMYDYDEIYSLSEYHDSYVWDYVRKVFESEMKVQNNNIGDNNGGHVQARSILGTVYDHTKGKRKLIGKSPEAKI